MDWGETLSNPSCLYILTKMRNIILFLLISLLATRCMTINKQSRLFKKITGVSASGIRADSSVYSVKGDNFKMYKLEFTYKDSGFTGADHAFSFKQNDPVLLLLKAPTFISKHDYFGSIYYAYPACKLRVTQNEEGEILITDINGDKQKNNEINFFQKLILQTGPLEGSFANIYLNPEQIKNVDTVYKLENKIGLLKQNRLFFLDSISSRHLMSNNFKRVAAETIHYLAIQDSIELYFNFKNLLIQNNQYDGKVKNILKCINSIKIYPTYFFDKICQSVFNLVLGKPYWRSMIWNEQEFYDNIDTIKKYFHNLAKDYMLLSQYTNAAKKYTISNGYFSTLLTEVKDPAFRSILLREHQFNQRKWAITINSGKKDIISLDGKTNSLEEIFEKYKGKLILMDFWASWCAPCIENMPFSIELEKQYKNKGIVFIYVSLDKDEVKWQVSNFSEQLNGKNSFRFINFKESAFLKNFGIDEIPRYMLIDKTGKVVNDNAPSPATDSLKILINSLL